jgi:hypothetical protein
MRKAVSELTLSDFDDASVWRLVEAEVVEPLRGVEAICEDDAPSWIRFNAKLADETPVRGIARAHCSPAALSDHVFIIEGRRYPLSNPAAAAEQFAAALQRSVAHVFPIFIRAEIKSEATGDVIDQELDLDGAAE